MNINILYLDYSNLVLDAYPVTAMFWAGGFTFDYEDDYLLVEANGMLEDDVMMILENKDLL